MLKWFVIQQLIKFNFLVQIDSAHFNLKLNLNITATIILYIYSS